MKEHQIMLVFPLGFRAKMMIHNGLGYVILVVPFCGSGHVVCSLTAGILINTLEKAQMDYVYCEWEDEENELTYLLSSYSKNMQATI